MVSQASKSIAAWTFVLGLGLIGFGMLIIALPELFAFLAALIFFIAGFGVAMTALKNYLAQRQIDKMTEDLDDDMRHNVRIHRGDDEFFE